MIGSIIGDIAGSRFEFNNARSDNFKLLDMDCSFTDDTICTVAIADAILTGKSYKAALVEWCSRYLSPMGGYGARFAQWIADPQHMPYDSFGNGAAMRVAPIGFAFDNTMDIWYEAGDSARCSHNHELGIAGAIFTAMSVKILRDKNLTAFIEYARKTYPEWPAYKPFSQRFNETCQGTLPVAISCFVGARDFEDAIRRSILVGGDSDTIASIVGGWAEAYFGVPEILVKQANRYLPADMKRVISRFYAHYMNSAANTTR